MKYRGEAEDAKRIISELGGRSKEDVEAIAGLRAELEDAKQKLSTEQVGPKSFPPLFLIKYFLYSFDRVKKF